MSDTTVRLQRATDLLRIDLESIKDLFKQFEAVANPPERRGLFGRIRRELTIHTRIVVEIFYPAIVELGTESGAADIVQRALLDHRTLTTLLDELSELDPESAGGDSKIKELSREFARHAHREEQEMFPLFEKLAKETRDQISEKLARRKIDVEAQEMDEEEP